LYRKVSVVRPHITMTDLDAGVLVSVSLFLFQLISRLRAFLIVLDADLSFGSLLICDPKCDHEFFRFLVISDA
jgi:hypothetical protein